jgi:hypothetical protein
MSQDPYTPPNAPVRDRKPEAAGSTWKAVTFGVLADIGATFLVSVLLYVVLGSMLLSQGASPPELDSNLMSSQAYLMLSAAIGLACTVLGGHVAARVANQREYYHAMLTGVAVLVFGELMLSLSAENYPLAYRIIGDVLVIPAAIFGGHLRKRAKYAEAA